LYSNIFDFFDIVDGVEIYGFDQEQYNQDLKKGENCCVEQTGFFGWGCGVIWDIYEP
jgi:hypothetical protein